MAVHESRQALDAMGWPNLNDGAASTLAEWTSIAVHARCPLFDRLGSWESDLNDFFVIEADRFGNIAAPYVPQFGQDHARAPRAECAP
jgi:hypothetical protein